jgi:MFS transporter, FSR family, fosmidomycin resistance protein
VRRVFRNPAVLAVSLGHLTVDILSNSLPLLLVVFAAQLGLSNVGLGTAATLYILAASLAQPFFGLLTDRWNSRWLAVGAMLWQAGGFTLAGLLPGYASLAALIFAGFGSAAFNPQGALNARVSAVEDASS